MSNYKNGTLYVGVTSNIVQRAYNHKNGIGSEFTKKNSLFHLVWFEIHEDIQEAILREKQLKRWKRQWKINLIERTNPSWQDLYPLLVDGCLPSQA